jgi:hypothetical protein
MRHFTEEAKLHALDRLPQPPPYVSYWYDPIIHALVGLHVGLDLHRHDGRYYAIETNLAPTLRPERRALYDTPLDPMISALVAVARSRRFERLVFFRRSEWSKLYLDEFQFASRHSGLQVLGLTAPSLPERLSANTIYVANSTQRSLLCRFVHDKYWSAKWLKETIDAEADWIKLLAYVPTFDHPVLPKEPRDPGWPNLVIKLSAKDRGEAVVFGPQYAGAWVMQRDGARPSRPIPLHHWSTKMAGGSLPTPLCGRTTLLSSFQAARTARRDTNGVSFRHSSRSRP